MGKQYLGLRGKNLIRFSICSVVAPAYILLGYNNAVAGGLLSLDSFIQQFPRINTETTEGSVETENARIQGTVVALYTVGCMIGALSCFKLGDILGRLRTITMGCIFIIIGSILLSSSFSLGQFIVGRLVLGFGFGSITATVPVWQSESSPAHDRGALVVLEGVFASAGLALSQWIDLGFFFVHSSAAWRFPLAFPIVLAGLILCAVPFLPDSPRWLVKKGRIAEATRVLAILEDAPEDSDIVARDIRKMELSLAETGKGSFRGLLHNGPDRVLNRTLISMFSTFSQQMNGIGIIGFYTTTIFKNLIGLPSLDARILSACTYMWQLCTAFVAFYTIDRLGRRKLMLFGTVSMGIIFIVLAGAISHAATSKACAIVATICVFLFAAAFSIGALGINYLYGTEVAPLAYRVPIYALTSGTLWSFNFLVVEITPIGFDKLGYKYFIVFAAINLCLLTPVIYLFFPETRRRSLEDMDTVFLGADSAFDVVKVAKSLPLVTVQTMEQVMEEGNVGGVHSDRKGDVLEHVDMASPMSGHESKV